MKPKTTLLSVKSILRNWQSTAHRENWQAEADPGVGAGEVPCPPPHIFSFFFFIFYLIRTLKIYQFMFLPTPGKSCIRPCWQGTSSLCSSTHDPGHFTGGTKIIVFYRNFSVFVIIFSLISSIVCIFFYFFFH